MNETTSHVTTFDRLQANNYIPAIHVYSADRNKIFPPDMVSFDGNLYTEHDFGPIFIQKFPYRFRYVPTRGPKGLYIPIAFELEKGIRNGVWIPDNPWSIWSYIDYVTHETYRQCIGLSNIDDATAFKLIYNFPVDERL